MTTRRGFLVGMAATAAGLTFLPVPVAGVEDIEPTRSAREMADDLVSMESAYAMAMSDLETVRVAQLMSHYLESWDV